jgi:hypothetical protein
LFGAVGGSAQFLLIPLAVGLIALLTLAVRRRGVPADIQPAALVRSMLDDSLCAACGYPIGGAAADLDGCSICPECGAAWRIPIPGAPFNVFAENEDPGAGPGVG